MRILHFSKPWLTTASARAVLALDQALRAAGVDSRICVPASTPCQALTQASTEAMPVASTTLAVIQRCEFDENRGHPFASGFTLGYPGEAVAESVADADVIHLH